MEIFVIKPEIVKKLTRDKNIMRMLEDYLNVNYDTIRRIIRLKDERLVSKNVVTLIATALKLKEDEILIKVEK